MSRLGLFNNYRVQRPQLKALQPDRSVDPLVRSEQESAVQENRAVLRLTRRELETWLWWNCEPTPQAKASRDWKPST